MANFHILKEKTEEKEKEKKEYFTMSGQPNKQKYKERQGYSANGSRKAEMSKKVSSIFRGGI